MQKMYIVFDLRGKKGNWSLEYHHGEIFEHIEVPNLLDVEHFSLMIMADIYIEGQFHHRRAHIFVHLLLLAVNEIIHLSVLHAIEHCVIPHMLLYMFTVLQR